MIWTKFHLKLKPRQTDREQTSSWTAETCEIREPCDHQSGVTCCMYQDEFNWKNGKEVIL
jgi:hypothetical protein